MDTKELNGALERVERRLFLRRGGLFTLGATAALALAAPGRALAMKSNTSEAEDIAILNVALSLEHQAIAAYQVGAESGLLQEAVLDLAVQFQGHHKAHADILAATVGKLGGKPAEAMKAA